MQRVNIGILGAGGIAQKMAKTITAMPEVRAYAVAARDKARAGNFAETFGIENSFGSYREMLADPELELVYIATPHSHHYEHIKLCLEHGKHVLCEKAFTVNAKQAKEVLTLARQKKLLLAEALWTRYMPMSQKINDLIANDTIGKVRSLTANLGGNISHVERLWNPALAGGALLDLGVYLINFSFMVLGNKVKSTSSSVTLYQSGVDAASSFTLTYGDGTMAILHANSYCVTDRKGIIYGDKGYLVVENVNNPESVAVYNHEHKKIDEFFAPEQITGFEYQVESCIRAIKAGQIECPEMPHSEIIKVMEMMDRLRAKWGVRYTELGE